MSLSRIWVILRKDLALGPRSPIFLYAVALPVVLTAIFQLAFGSLFDPEPRMAVVDDGASQITSSLRELEGVELTVLDSAEALRQGVEANDHDVGLVLPAGFDDAVRAGQEPPLEMYVSGGSLAADRMILSVTTIDLIRAVEGGAPPVDVELVQTGDAGLPISVRLVPVLVMYALFVAGTFVPASSIVDEKIRGTLTAILVTPARVSEVLAAKASLGVLLAFLMSVVTLLLNGAVGSSWAHLLVVVLLGATFTALLGLLIGTVAKDGATLFTIVKSSGILIFGPVIFYLFPEWPQWIARLFPTYWVIDPIWRVAVLGEGLADVWVPMVVAVGLGGLLVLLVRRLSGRMLARATAAS
ncbi:ABC transporter permease [Actinotalea sp. K2]|uniref:ABC transporter permease n=1 Tax=Actinotalea sp. K2 TaxID=2939438 RepID=UPI002017C2D0|nr:ABC transporter permease [Actinotalea sp. K2]MCL3859616.1 ABC transporter permease [Actinotalea sp. K2]